MGRTKKVTEAEKEKELLETYTMDETIEEKNVEENNNEEKIEEYEFSEEQKPKKKHNKITLIMNIVFVVVLVLIAMVATDIVMVKNYHKGPYFAIKVKTYNDGGTKEYIGLGYKVIKYNQQQGRRDTELGTWLLKYNSNTIDVDAIDLAIEFNEDEAKAFKKYNGKFLRVSGVLTNVSLNENTITISYEDEDGKYSYDILCDMASDKKALKEFITEIRVTAIGTVSSYDYKSPDTNPTLHLKDCFAEQSQVDD